jgi:hypothetical protein
MNYLVETKTEYTIQLTNILVPLIFEGISSIYEDAIKIANKDEELKTFQIFLKKIPKWNVNLLDNETNRILCMSTCPELLKNLLNAVIKANIMILTNTQPSDKSSIKINTKFSFKEFIHNCYIESARIFYNNPFLFYHKHSIYDINRNQKDAKENIKNAIIEAIRKMLPLKMIIKEYLGNSFKDNTNINIDNTLSEAEMHNLNNMIKIDNTNNDDFIKIQDLKPDNINLKPDNINLKPDNIDLKPDNIDLKPDNIDLKPDNIDLKPDNIDLKPDNIDLKSDKINSLKSDKINSLKSELKIKSDKINSLKSDKINSLKSDKINSLKLGKKKIDEECESISYYKNDAKNKVADSFSNINTQQIFMNNFSVELSDDKKEITEKKKFNINHRKIINY